MRAIEGEGDLLPINMGWVLRQDGDPDGAQSSFNTALRIYRRRGIVPHRARFTTTTQRHPADMTRPITFRSQDNRDAHRVAAFAEANV